MSKMLQPKKEKKNLRKTTQETPYGVTSAKPHVAKLRQLESGLLQKWDLLNQSGVICSAVVRSPASQTLPSPEGRAPATTSLLGAPLTSLFVLPSACKSLLLCTAPQSSFLSSRLDADS